MKLQIFRYYCGGQYRFTLRKLDRTAPFCRWFNTMGQARQYALENGFEIVERPDLIKKWSTPHLNRVLDV